MVRGFLPFPLQSIAAGHRLLEPHPSHAVIGLQFAELALHLIGLAAQLLTLRLQSPNAPLRLGRLRFVGFKRLIGLHQLQFQGFHVLRPFDDARILIDARHMAQPVVANPQAVAGDDALTRLEMSPVLKGDRLGFGRKHAIQKGVELEVGTPHQGDKARQLALLLSLQPALDQGQPANLRRVQPGGVAVQIVDPQGLHEIAQNHFHRVLPPRHHAERLAESIRAIEAPFVKPRLNARIGAPQGGLLHSLQAGEIMAQALHISARALKLLLVFRKRLLRGYVLRETAPGGVVELAALPVKGFDPLGQTIDLAAVRGRPPLILNLGHAGLDPLDALAELIDARRLNASIALVAGCPLIERIPVRLPLLVAFLQAPQGRQRLAVSLFGSFNDWSQLGDGLVKRLDFRLVKAQLMGRLLATLHHLGELGAQLLKALPMEADALLIPFDVGAELVETPLRLGERIRRLGLIGAKLLDFRLDATLFGPLALKRGVPAVDVAIHGVQAVRKAAALDGAQLRAQLPFVSLKRSIPFRRLGLTLQPS